MKLPEPGFTQELVQHGTVWLLLLVILVLEEKPAAGISKLT